MNCHDMSGSRYGNETTVYIFIFFLRRAYIFSLCGMRRVYLVLVLRERFLSFLG
jgi:hypothetical protein